MCEVKQKYFITVYFLFYSECGGSNFHRNVGNIYIYIYFIDYLMKCPCFKSEDSKINFAFAKFFYFFQARIII
jgi:hypothetical protein